MPFPAYGGLDWVEKKGPERLALANLHTKTLGEGLKK